MDSRFINLPEEKKQAIIASAIKEFAAHNYDKASTDVIAQQAGISKGSLFNYFKNKLNLYRYILEHCTVLMAEELIAEIEQIEEIDFYDRLKKITLLKYNSILKHGEEAQILSQYFFNPISALKEPIPIIERYLSINDELIDKYLIQYIDESKLREGVTKQDVIFITFTFAEAIGKKHEEMERMMLLGKMPGMEKGLADFDKYIEILKHGVYKV
ncbi:hypothetical protein CS063_02965 [Sporanaerobium hydrogeniformans]|uniref:Uncharacterized protein n=1 Tax=Sporanaerobium hydrogeniformans TaxID=3072179 RepID=A0AC61DFP1_9FIRM|nr:TetR/AcrR family transcriptional regulator [Sporanaerobium hydrogeniformans]PHV71546.1 hypothetical protein CS063_02965 [Sporanaerobium hydrogeniformans]